MVMAERTIIYHRGYGVSFEGLPQEATAVSAGPLPKRKGPYSVCSAVTAAYKRRRGHQARHRTLKPWDDGCHCPKCLSRAIVRWGLHRRRKCVGRTARYVRKALRIPGIPHARTFNARCQSPSGRKTTRLGPYPTLSPIALELHYMYACSSSSCTQGPGSFAEAQGGGTYDQGVHHCAPCKTSASLHPS